MALPYVVAGAGALSSLISDIITSGEARRNKKRAYDSYARLLRSNTEMLTRADREGDNFYTRAMNEMNEGAFAARGALNPGMLKTIAYAKMAAGRSGIESQSRMSDEAYNDQIRNKLAEINATPVSSVDPIRAITAGVEGYFAGKQLEMTEGLMKKQGEFYDYMMNKPTQSSFFGFGSTKPSEINKPLLPNLLFNKLKEKQLGRLFDTPINYGNF